MHLRGEYPATFISGLTREGTARREKIEPICPTSRKGTKDDARFHDLVALWDALRVGKPREAPITVMELRRRILLE